MQYALSTARLKTILQGLASKDDGVARAVARFGFPNERRSPATFETLVRALASQQLSVTAAATIFGRIQKHYGPDLTPQRLARARIPKLRDLGLSGRKAESLKGLSRAALAGQLEIEDFPTMSDDEIIAQISAVKGFGVWSAQMYLIFSLGRRDVWPATDLGVQRGLQWLRGLPELPDKKSTEELGEAFAPSRSAAAILCWHVARQARQSGGGIEQ